MVMRNMDVESALVERDAVVKALYGYMFDWLISRINKAAAVSEEDMNENNSFIGILDIFGFEIFETNSLSSCASIWQMKNCNNISTKQHLRTRCRCITMKGSRML